MPRSPLPTRPRLAEYVSPRRHQSQNEEAWVLHDERSGLAFRLGNREWGLLAQADGTRDLEGILAAAARSGTYARISALQTFLEALHEADLLADGVGPTPETPVAAPARPLDPLPDFRLICDGLGSCCRLYATVMFRPREEAVARSLLPHILDAGDHPERAFAPVSGSSPCGVSSIGFVDGRCAYLGSNGRCGLHAAGGTEGKPLGCRMFPALFVDDGHSIRVSPAVECACVLASVGVSHEGDSLVPNQVTSSDKLDPGIHIARLPDMILVTQKRYGSRDELIAWSRIVAQAPPSHDTLGIFLALADEVETWGLDPRAATRALSSPRAADPESMRPALFALVERTRRRLNIDAAWRSENDLALRSIRWISQAATLLLAEPSTLEQILATPPSTDEAIAEAFYLRAGAHGHQFVLGDAPLAYALRDRAIRIVLTRAFSRVVGPDEHLDEPALRHPLALVEATLRGHGLLSRGALL